MIEVINKILGLSSCKLILSKPLSKPLFINHIPVPMSERLKTWNDALLIDKSQLHTLCYSTGREDVNVLDEIFSTLHCSLVTICSKATYSPNRLLKSTLLTSLELLSSFFTLNPEDSCNMYCDDVVTIATDVLCEFAAEGDVASEGDVYSGAPLKDIALLFNDKEFSVKCMRYKVGVVKYMYYNGCG